MTRHSILVKRLYFYGRDALDSAKDKRREVKSRDCGCATLVVLPSGRGSVYCLRKRKFRMRPVFSEGGGGAVKEFWFQSAANGEMVIDRMTSADSARYELYQSPNGGETWIIRRTSEKPIAIRRPATDAGSEGWRIRADGRSKSFVIENRAGEHWKTAASFLVAIGNCKPAPRAVPPQPEPGENAEPAPAAPAKPPSLKPKN
jgi:hypothetical protein